MQQTTLSKVVQSLRAADRIAIVTHISPDPDAIGSALGLTHALLALGKQVVPLVDDDLPETVNFLPGVELMQRELPPNFTPDLVVSLDASDVERLGAHGALVLSGQQPVLNIDHHVTNLSFGSLNYVDATAAATAELLVPLVEELGVPLDGAVATCLAAALVSDTRSFSIPSVTARTLQVGARLLEAGADLSDITNRILNQRTYNSLRVWHLGLERMKLEDGVIWTSLPYKDRKERGLLNTESQGLSNLLLSVDEAMISAVFTERTDGQIDVSFRAVPGFDVASVALALGGGGHPLAAGCLLEGDLDEMVNMVVAQLKAQVAERIAEEG